jgi:RimJ/RimL family protein N-acetyltransferase
VVADRGGQHRLELEERVEERRERVGEGGHAGQCRRGPSCAAAAARYHPRVGQTWVRPVTLTGRRVRLEPLDERHLDDLGRVAADDVVFRWITNKPMDDAALRAWFDTTRATADEGSEVPFATIDLASERAVGSTRFMTIAPEHRRLEIGWTWLGVAFQRSGANREAKFLQLTHAFDTLGAERVEFKTHARNVASRTALLGIGATFEGVLRHHTIMPDGSNRDSAFYGVIAPEWPAVKARLETLVAR